MLNFIICDDTHAQSIKDAVEPILQELNLGKIVLAETKPNSVLDYIESNEEPSVYLLDIELSALINGIDMARLIREKDDDSYIIFITSHEEFAIMTYKYKLHVMDYIVKPLNQQDIRNCLQTILESEINKKNMQKINNQENNILNIKSGCQQHMIDIRDIIYFEVIKNKIIIHTEKGQISFFSTMKEIKDKLFSMKIDRFVVSHKSYLVNMKKIESVEKSDITMSNGYRCPLSRNYRKEIINAINS